MLLELATHHARTLGLALALLVSCDEGATGQDAPPDGSGGGGGSEEGGTGASPPALQSPYDATTPQQCEYVGYGGSDCATCTAVTVNLSSPIPRSDLAIAIETSVGDTFETVNFEGPDGALGVAAIEDPVEALTIQQMCPGGETHYAPTWIDVTVKRQGQTVGSALFENLVYSCYSVTSDQWCWGAEPVTLEVTP